jgi:PPOX class probable F420-dependent enzyme
VETSRRVLASGLRPDPAAANEAPWEHDGVHRSVGSEPLLTAAESQLLVGARRAVLCTIAPDGSPRPVPVCYAALWDGARDVADGGEVLLIYTPLDAKPKTLADPRDLARVRDIEARPQVTLLVDRWHEDWTKLAWLRINGNASLLNPADGPGDRGAGGGAGSEGSAVAVERSAAIEALRARYPQYDSQDLESRPIIRIEVVRVSSWCSVPE